MHANAIRFGDSAVIFSGPSGVGKSTTAAIFHQMGYQILTDDVCIINQENYVVPGYPQIKLWRDSAEAIGNKVDSLRKIRPNLEKYAINITKQYCQDNLPLVAAYFLDTHNLESIKINEVRGMNKFPYFRDNTYRPRFAEKLGLSGSQLRQFGSLVSGLSVATVTRPKIGFERDMFFTSLVEDLKGKGISF